MLYPDKNGRVSDLLAEARKQMGVGAGQKLRMLEISNCRLMSQVREDMALDNLTYLGTKMYHIEEVPPEEATLLDDECLVPVAHFHKVRSTLHELYTENTLLSLTQCCAVNINPLLSLLNSGFVLYLQEPFQTFGRPFLLKVCNVSCHIVIKNASIS